MRPYVSADGRILNGITAVEITRSVEAACGAFRVQAVLRPGTAVRVGSRVLIDLPRDREPSARMMRGWAERVQVSVSSSGGRTLSISGRDITCDLVDGTWPDWPTEWTDTTLLQVARDIALPVGIQVIDELGEPLHLPRFAVQPGETGWDAISRAAAQVGVLAVTTLDGRLAITRQTRIRATKRLVEGQNVHQLSANYDDTQRFAEYTVRGQAPTTDEVVGEAATEVEGLARDPGVRAQRRMLMLADGIADRDTAQARAEWEAAVRAARAQAIACRVQGWDQGGLRQNPWRPWNIVRCEFPSLGIDQDLSVGEVRNTWGSAGSFTELRLMRGDAFLPEPEVPELDLSEALLETGEVTA